MSRDIPIGNGTVLIAFDKDALLRELFFPYVGQESHTKGEPFRIGVFVDGQMRWIPDGWQIECNYLDDSLVTQVNLFHEECQIKLTFNDGVDYEENIYLKKITVENLSDEPRDVTLFFGLDFHIYGTEIGDTAVFRPEINALVHYKLERYFLANILANHKFGIDFYATGNKETERDVGTWRDAEDGLLSQNPIAQGSVDSTYGIPLALEAHGTEICYTWIAIGKNWEEVKTLNEFVKKKTPEILLERTFNYWKLWVDKEKLNYSLLPEKIAKLYKRSLLICRTQINNSGSIIAANDSDAIAFNRDTYSYMWPRDGAIVAYGLDLGGYQLTRNFYEFCSKILTSEGYFLHKYTPSGALGSSWHSWIHEKKTQLPIQEDETALVIWALWNHYCIFRDIEFISSLYHRFIKKAADFMMNYRDSKTGLPLPSFDLWEERQGILTFTVSTVYGGLMAAAHFARLFGDTGLAEEYAGGAKKIREAMDQTLYLPDKNRFARMIQLHKDGSIEVDDTVDASLYGTFAFGAYEARDPKVKHTMDQIIEKLWIPEAGGLIRYENDPYYRQDTISNPWFVTTLWLAQYKIACATTREELDQSLEILDWVANHALPSGVLAEQVNPKTHEPISVSPLTWSHGTFIAVVQEYLNKLLELEKCPTCGLSKFSKNLR